MAMQAPLPDDSIEAFFSRNGLVPETQALSECHALLERLFPQQLVRPTSSQGFCSYTVLVGHDEAKVVQFRPVAFALDLQLTTAACDTYGTRAPKTRLLATLVLQSGEVGEEKELLVYEMTRLNGVSLKQFHTIEQSLYLSLEEKLSRRRRLCEDFAGFVATSWRRGQLEYVCRGMVGSSLRQRVDLLSIKLPPRFQSVVQTIRENLDMVLDLPWVFSHGDVASGNVMVDPESGNLTGLVDWAEAELLPFGICLYGLEELLGGSIHDRQLDVEQTSKLKAAFWSCLRQELPELVDPVLQYSVDLARHLGVLLWHGFAWDEGAINRVVEENRDLDEIAYLDALLPTNLLPPPTQIIPKGMRTWVEITHANL